MLISGRIPIDSISYNCRIIESSIWKEFQSTPMPGVKWLRLRSDLDLGALEELERSDYLERGTTSNYSYARLWTQVARSDF